VLPSRDWVVTEGVGRKWGTMWVDAMIGIWGFVRRFEWGGGKLTVVR